MRLGFSSEPCPDGPGSQEGHPRAPSAVCHGDLACLYRLISLCLSCLMGKLIQDAFGSSFGFKISEGAGVLLPEKGN